jgi:hypothetical protein
MARIWARTGSGVGDSTPGSTRSRAVKSQLAFEVAATG